MDDARLQRFIDRTEVSDVVRAYFMALDRFDWDTVAGLVADEFFLEADAPGAAPHAVPRGEFIRTLKARNGGFTCTVHINPGHIVEIDGDTARLTSHCWAAHGVGPAAEDMIWGFGMYHFELIRTDAGWKLSRQRNEVVGGFGDPVEVFRRAMERQEAGLGRG